MWKPAIITLLVHGNYSCQLHFYPNLQLFYSRNVTSQTCHSSLSAVWFAAHRWPGSKRPKIMLSRLVTQILEKCKEWTDAIDCELRPTFVLTKACDSSRGWEKCILPWTEMHRYGAEWWQMSIICRRIPNYSDWRVLVSADTGVCCSAWRLHKWIRARYPASLASLACRWNCDRTQNKPRPQSDEQCDVMLVKQLRTKVWS